MAELKWDDVAAANSNFGLLDGGWIRVAMPELGLDQDLVGYSNDAVANAAKRSDPDFEGVVGLPFLRLFEFGGDPDSFWLRRL